MVFLLVHPPRAMPYPFKLHKKRTNLGRDSSNDLVLEDPCCSPRHAVILRLKEGYVVRDLDSKNGIYINGKRIKGETVLRMDEIIRLGLTEILFDVDINNPPLNPSTVEEAADTIINFMSDRDKKLVRKTKKESLAIFHHGWGTGIRNVLGLWKENNPIMKSSSCMHPDECSMMIIERIWEKLQK